MALRQAQSLEHPHEPKNIEKEPADWNMAMEIIWKMSHLQMIFQWKHMKTFIQMGFPS